MQIRLMSAYRHRNYAFGLNSTLTVDASYAGNESRFINHFSSEGKRGKGGVNAKAEGAYLSFLRSCYFNNNTEHSQTRQRRP
jgi:hypothetical protein